MLFGWLHLLFFGIVVPIVALRTRDVILRLPSPPNRIPFYLGALAQLVIFTAISVFVAWREKIELFPRRMPTGSQALIGLAILITLVALLHRQWKRSVLNGERVIALFMPSTRDERLLWLLVSLFAGISEEITWRGVQSAIVHRLTGVLAIAIIASTITFAVAHAVQGFEAIPLIAAIALVFHGLVLLTGSLYVAMAVHFLYDAICGFTYAKLAARYGYRFGSPAEKYEHLR